MNIKARQGRAETRTSQYGRPSAVLLILWVMLMSFSPVLTAQVPEQAGQNTSGSGQIPLQDSEDIESITETVEIDVSLPDSHQMAMALATPGLREQTLLDLAVAANVLIRAKDDLEVNHTALAKAFLDDRAWLQVLVDRYGWVQPHSSVLDPAAWLVLEELQQHDIEDMTLIFPGRTPWAVLNYQVFQRAEERLAVANLPMLLLEIEADAVSIWEAFLQLTIAQEQQDVAWKEVEETWFKDRRICGAGRWNRA